MLRLQETPASRRDESPSAGCQVDGDFDCHLLLSWLARGKRHTRRKRRRRRAMMRPRMDYNTDWHLIIAASLLVAGDCGCYASLGRGSAADEASG